MQGKSFILHCFMLRKASIPFCLHRDKPYEPPNYFLLYDIMPHYRFGSAQARYRLFSMAKANDAVRVNKEKTFPRQGLVIVAMP